MAARIRRTTAVEMPEGEEAITASKYNELVKQLSKYHVSLLDINGEYRSTYDIIKDISDVWEQMSSMEQAALAETIAGTRSQNVFFSLVEQFREAEGALETANQAAGAMAEAYDTVLNSIEGRLGVLKASYQTLSYDFISSDTFKYVVNLLTGITQIGDALARINVLLPVTLSLFATIKSVGKPKMTGFKHCPHKLYPRGFISEFTNCK